MHFERRITQALHHEHIATIALLERLEALLTRQRGNVPADTDGETGKLLGDLAVNLENEVGRHFGIEQERLFPLLTGGEKMIADLLTDEHEAILPLASSLANLARSIRKNGFEAANWQTFRTLGGELIERQISHIQKEEMGLLPMLDQVLDPEQDDAIADDYLMTQ